ncbi:MAG: pilus assembly protein TadG-related protein [Nocardioides sp.]
MGERPDQRGSATVLIVGLAVVLLMMTAVVTDASAAYLRRQGLDTLADGAALSAADAAASGAEAYGVGLDADLHLDPVLARAAASAYLHRTGAFERYPGLIVEVRVDPTSARVTVAVHAPLHLPLQVPGGPGQATISATSAASVAVD